MELEDAYEFPFIRFSFLIAFFIHSIRLYLRKPWTLSQ